jgi:hypothetical protein
VIWQKNNKVRYPDRWFQKLGIPSPRQYIIWEKLIQLIGEDEFFNDPRMEEVSLYKNEVLLIKNHIDLLVSNDEITITFACGYFWKGKYKCRNRMMELLADNIKKGKWKLVVYTQDKTLENEFNSNYNVYPEVHRVPYRIDLHYIIIENHTNPEKSYIFLELPHTEKVYHRLYYYFSFDKADKFKCKKDGLKDFLAKQTKSHFFNKSLPSFFNVAYK